MEKKLLIRLILLLVTLGIAILLFILNIRRSAPENLPPTPTINVIETTSFQTEATLVNQHYPSSTPLATVVSTATIASTENNLLTSTEMIQDATLSGEEMTSTMEATHLLATQQAQDMRTLVEQLYYDGLIDTTEGEFHSIPDFSETWDKPGYFQWWRTEYRLKDFILRANVSWKSDDPEPDTTITGCGLVFADNGTENMIRTFLFLDGHVRVYRMLANRFDDIAYGYYPQIYSPSGNAEVIYAVRGKTFYMYVNEELLIEEQLDYLTDGYIGFAITSGTAEGYTITCDMFDIELWTFPE